MIGRKSGFTAVEIVLVVVVIGLVAGLGWLYYDRSQDQDEVATQDQAKNTESEESSKKEVCKEGDASAVEGVFCAQDVGVKLSVPDVFADRFKKIDNYDVMTQQSTKGEGTVFGKSIAAYQAEIKDEKTERSMMIAKEPLRTFSVRSSMPAMFDKDTREVRYSDGKKVNTVTIDGKKFYNYGIGDAGFYSDTYLAVTGDELTVISFTSQEQLGPNAGGDRKFDLDAVIKQFNDRTKNLNWI